jgi:hypothetical protein
MNPARVVRRTARAISIALAITCLSLLLAGCFAKVSTSNKTPVASVEGLLELRSHNSTDTAAYLRHVANKDLAAQLAADSAEQTGTPIPFWRAPKLAKQTTSTAEVTVQWIASKRFPGWASKTVFALHKAAGDGWLVVDARDESASKEETSAP